MIEIASSVNWFARYTNCQGGSLILYVAQRFSSEAVKLFGIDLIMVVLKHCVMGAWLREVLKMSTRTSDSWSVDREMSVSHAYGGVL